MNDDNKTSEDKLGDNKGPFMGIPLRGWAIAAVSLIVVGYALCHFALKLYYEAKTANSQLAQAVIDRKSVV